MHGIDLIDLGERYDADRFFNIIDGLFIDDLLLGAELEGGIEAIRTKLASVYNDSRNGSSNDEVGGYVPRETRPIVWTEQNESGYAGLEAPLG